MPARYARLRSEWVLRGWQGIPWAVLNWTNGRRWDLDATAFYVARACDGKTNFDSIAFLPTHHAILQRFCREGVAEYCEEGLAIDSHQEYRKADNPLTALHWAITGRCNLNCRHCYMEAPSARYGEMPFEAMLKLIDQLERANVLEVTLTGGEPFVRKDFFDLLAVLREKKIRVNRIYTNGTLIREDTLDAIMRLGLSPGFQISLDGYGSHEQMRGRGGIEQGVIRAIRAACAAGFETSVATCIDRLNKDRLLATFDLLKDLPIHYWRVTTPLKAGNWRRSPTALSLEEEADACLPVLRRWIEEGKPFGLQLGKFFITGMGRLGDRLEPHRLHFTQDSYDCGDCHERSYLLPDGVLIPCPGFADTRFRDGMPSLFDVELSRVWVESPLLSIMNTKKKDLLAHNRRCIRCKWFEECGLGCRASAVMATGDLHAKDPVACAMWRGGFKQRFLDLLR